MKFNKGNDFFCKQITKPASLVLFFFMMLLVNIDAHAEEIISKYQLPYMGIRYGIAEVDNSSFDKSYSYGIMGGVYLLGNTSMELGYIWFEPFDLKGIDSTYIEIKGTHVGIAHRFALDRWFSLRPGIGAYFWGAESYYDGYFTGRDSGASLTANLSLQFNIGWEIMFLEARWMGDVSGADIIKVSFGVGVKF